MAKAFFSDDAARRIVSATIKVEGMPLDHGAITSTYRGGDDGDGFKLAKTIAAWTKGTSATLAEYSGAAGSETAVAGVTISAFNHLGDIEAGKWVLVASVNGEWYLVAAEATEVTVITGASLGTGGLTFTRETVLVFGKKAAKPADAVISTTACP